MRFILSSFFLICQCAYAQDARDLIKKAVDYWRGTTSYVEAEMTIHRPDWERTSKFVAWTKGRKQTLVRFIAPAKDKGNASLTLDHEMWSFNPKINRIIKIPASMVQQSWMGSDFSYADLSKDDQIINDYEHKLIGTQTVDNIKIYVIESTPHDDAAVVWGKEVIKVREDSIIQERTFYDQDFKAVKRLYARKIALLGGKLYATIIRMQKLEVADEWTEVAHTQAKFGIEIDNNFFSQANLSLDVKW